MKPYERFLEYVKINTQSDESTGHHPSFDGEFDLAKKLLMELKNMGVDAALDDKCYLMAHIPPTERSYHSWLYSTYGHGSGLQRV